MAFTDKPTKDRLSESVGRGWETIRKSIIIRDPNHRTPIAVRELKENVKFFLREVEFYLKMSKKLRIVKSFQIINCCDGDMTLFQEEGSLFKVLWIDSGEYQVDHELTLMKNGDIIIADFSSEPS